MPSGFHFGQVVYVMSAQSQQIYPAIIKNEIITKGFDGEKISYVVQMGPKEKAKIVNLDKIDGEVFGTIEEVRARLDQELQSLINSFNDNVDKLCNNAAILTAKWYGEDLEKIKTNIGSDPSKIDPAALLSEPNQQMVYVPQVQQMQQPIMPYSQNPMDQQQALRQTLMQRVAIEPETLQGDVVQMPDGRVLPIRQG